MYGQWKNNNAGKMGEQIMLVVAVDELNVYNHVNGFALKYATHRIFNITSIMLPFPSRRIFVAPEKEVIGVGQQPEHKHYIYIYILF